MGALTILMALLMLASGAGLILERAVVPVALLCLAGGLAGLWLWFRAFEPVARQARRAFQARAATRSHLAAALYGASSAAAIVAYQQASAYALGPGGPTRMLLVLAVATIPATVLALRADRQRRTLWSIRAYAGHLSAWAMLLAAWFDLSPGATGLVMLLCHALPMIVGYLEARADPAVLATVRM